MKPLAVVLLLAALALLPGFPAQGAQQSTESERLRRLAGDRGCTVCHREAPAPRGSEGVMPLAPSWREIAARYRGDSDAEARLARIVIEGADPGERHWRNRLEFSEMRGNAERVTPDEARSLVRWILSLP